MCPYVYCEQTNYLFLRVSCVLFLRFFQGVYWFGPYNEDQKKDKRLVKVNFSIKYYTDN